MSSHTTPYQKVKIAAEREEVSEEAIMFKSLSEVRYQDLQREAGEAGVENIVTTIAEGPTVALTGAKRLLDRGTESTIEQALDREATTQGLVCTTDDHEEGATAFLEQREPEFEGR